MTQRRSKIYSDVDLTFGIHPLNNDITVLYDENAVKRAIKHILLSNKHDFKFHPQFDVGIRDLLFEPLGFATATILEKRITIILKQQMSRVRIIKIDVESNITYDGFDVELTFTTLNLITPITTKLFLQRIR
jgi:phage baseplate assembly protein W